VTLDYKQAGVDVAAGDALVDWLKATESRDFPHKEKLVAGIGGFAALFRADFSHMKEPCLVSCTDGVGTKVKLASQFSRYRGVGQDLVAMCVNDMICAGAQPLFFLDYYATGKLELESAKEFLAGVRAACHESECVLIGGETAEMPGVYERGDFDCAGFAVGVVDRTQALGPQRVQPNDQLLALASSGFHSNGYSLLRRLFEHDINEWVDRLMIPTALYARAGLNMINSGGVHAFAHITGGGLDNLPRILPKGTIARVEPWNIPDEFREVQRRSKMSWDELIRTLNCGIGLVAVVDKEKCRTLKTVAENLGHKAFVIGEVVKGQAGADPDWEPAPGREWGVDRE
jgi:phosphoribosylformylglycinamidine cyclo-ligase